MIRYELENCEAFADFDFTAAKIAACFEAFVIGPPELLSDSEFMRYCWRRYGTGRTAPDSTTPWRDHWRDSVWRNRVASLHNNRLVPGYDLPLGWHQFNLRACSFFRDRVHAAKVRRAAEKAR